jgi:hypothetical protein
MRSPELWARIANASLRSPSVIGIQPSSHIRPSGTTVRPSAAISERRVRALVPAYWPAQICHCLGRPSAREETFSTPSTIMSPMLVPANSPAAVAAVRMIGLVFISG